jgi:hypothetical protein
MTDQAQLLGALSTYREARRRFLVALGCSGSNRDPLAELAERLVLAVLGGKIAESRVQKGYDLIMEHGETVQVRYLANPADRWVNEHLVDFRGGCDRYALLIVEDLDARSLVIFAKSGLSSACTKLAKRHGNQDVTLQFTRANYRAIASEPDRFTPCGVVFVLLREGLPGGSDDTGGATKS